MKYTYNTSGICASSIDFEIEDGVIKSVRFNGGCDGSHKGIAGLCIGMKPEAVADRLEGIKCGFKRTSCPDQFAKALREYIGTK